MNAKQVFSSQYSRFRLNGIVKSAMYGSIFGFLAAVIASALFWFFDVKAFYLSIVIFAAVALTTGTLLYLFKFKPQPMQIARKLDKLGLEERLVTMTELENDDSFIASLQRADAAKATKTINSKLVKFAVSVPLVLGVTLALLLSGGMTTVNALSSAGVIRSGKQIIIDANTVPDVYCNVNYVIDGGGQILGKDAQVVLKGEGCSAVMAIADFGYAFVKWSDGNTNPYREDLIIEDDMLYTALFEAVSDLNEKEPVGDSGRPPYDPESEEGEESYPEWREPTESSDPIQDNNPSSTKSDEKANYVIDGKTYYGGVIFNQALTEATEQSTSNPNLTDGEKGSISDYFNNIKK